MADSQLNKERHQNVVMPTQGCHKFLKRKWGDAGL